MGFLDLSYYIDCDIPESLIVADISDEVIIDECYDRADRDFLIKLLKRVIEDNEAEKIIRTYTLK